MHRWEDLSRIKILIPLVSGFTVSHTISCVRSYRPSVFLTTSWSTVVNYPSRATEETLTHNKTYRRCHKNNERPTGINNTNWLGRQWNLKIKEIPILIRSNFNSRINLMMEWRTSKMERRYKYEAEIIDATEAGTVHTPHWAARPMKLIYPCRNSSPPNELLLVWF